MVSTLHHIIVFIIGGCIALMFKYISTKLTPSLLTIVATLPTGIFSAYFLLNEDKIPKYLNKYMKQITVLLSIAFIYATMLNHKLFSHRNTYIICILLWVLSIIYQLYHF
jgi:hypothetical protein